jgi:amino acid transporter/nucleotide-binding universal stress UspA family protein
MLVRHERPRDLRWYLAGPMFFGDLGTSRLYVLGLAVYFAGTGAPVYVAAVCGLLLTVGWAYTIICRIYPDGGGVYTSGRLLHPLLGAVGAIMLFANYVVTAAISTYEAVVYIGAPLGLPAVRAELPWLVPVLVILAFTLLAMLNSVGSRRAGTFALLVAVASVGVTAVLAAFTLDHVPEGWRAFQATDHNWSLTKHWTVFVAVVLALSGVESIANMTGVMVKPIGRTAKRSIWPVLAEVVLLNLILIFVVTSVPVVQDAGVIAESVGESGHTLTETDKRIKEHVLEVAASHYVSPIFGGVAAVIFGLLLLSATNTAIVGMISIQYAMSRNRELPAFFSNLNRFGVPQIALVAAVGLPMIVTVGMTLIEPQRSLELLASLYAIGVVGAIMINLGCAAYNRKLAVRTWERGAMWLLAGFLAAIWLTIATTNVPALTFIIVMLASGLTLRFIAQRGPVLVPARMRRRAPAEGAPAVETALPPFDPGKPKLLVATRTNYRLLKFAFDEARRRDANLFLLFVRDLAVMFPTDEHPLTPEEDIEADELFRRARDLSAEYRVPLQPIYCVSANPSDMILDFAATYAAELVILGVSRRAGLLRALRGDVITGVADDLPAQSTLLIHA